MITAFFHGFILAFSLILPLGAQNMFLFNRGAVEKRWLRLLPVVIVAALCDTFLILLAVLGVSVVVLTIAWVKTTLIIAGIIFLIYIGWSTWSSDHTNTSDPGVETEWSLGRLLLFTVSVSLLNPHAILDTIGVIGTNSLSYTASAKFFFTAACILVSWVWFLALALAGRWLGSVIALGNFRRILNRVSALIIWLSAVYLIVNLF